MITIRVHGTPAPQGSKKAFVNKKTGRAQVVDDNKDALRTWREAVKQAALNSAADWQADRGIEVGPWVPYAGPVSVRISLSFARPKHHYGTGRNADTIKDSAPTFVTTKPDVDKCIRSILDALTDAGVWRDDSQAADVAAYKRYVCEDETPGALITVRPLGGEISNSAKVRIEIIPEPLP